MTAGETILQVFASWINPTGDINQYRNWGSGFWDPLPIIRPTPHPSNNEQKHCYYDRGLGFMIPLTSTLGSTETFEVLLHKGLVKMKTMICCRGLPKIEIPPCSNYGLVASILQTTLSNVQHAQEKMNNYRKRAVVQQIFMNFQDSFMLPSSDFRGIILPWQGGGL